MKTFKSFWLCLCLALLCACGSGSGNGGDTLIQADAIELLDLLPATTRGVFQIYPGMSGALSTPAMSVPWAMGPLQLLQQYSSGMAIEAVASRLVLAQMADLPDQFVLLAALHTSDVNALTASLELSALDSYQGYQRWAIEGGDLQLAQLNAITLAIAPPETLMRVLDTYAGDEAGIDTGPLGGYLADLGAGQPNSFAYALAALYGPVAAPGSGDASLSQARVVSGAFSVEQDTLAGSASFHSDNAVIFTTRLLELLVDYRAPAISASGDIARVDLTGLSAQHDLRPLLKTLILDMDAVDYTDAVFFPGNNPWLNFKVGENPNSIFINFEFKNQAEREAFTAEHLPAGFSLAPIRILETDSPRYFLVLNIYQSSGGLVEGARAEWSVFVSDPDTGEPRFLVIEAVAESVSADSVNLLTLPEPVTHELKSNAIASYVGEVDAETEVETLYFESSIDWPQSPQTLVRFHREFVVSNDYIFWGNGVADRGLYNSTVHNREGVLVDPLQFSFVDNSEWETYISASPVHVVTYLNPLEIVISPWWNLGASYLDVSASYRQTLIDFKNNFYPALAQDNAQAAVRGDGIALRAFTLSGETPGAQYHFTLQNPQGLLSAVVGLDGATAVPVALFEDEAADYYLTLSLYRRENDPCGTTVEWITYVVGADGRPENLRLDSFSAQPCLDPVSLMTLATDLSQVVEDGVLTTRIASPFTRFRATVDLGLTDAVMIGQDGLEAGDRVCSVNNICDEFFYDGQLLFTPMLRANAPAVDIQEMTTPWDDFIDSASVRAGVRTNAALLASNRWKNLRAFAGALAPP